MVQSPAREDATTDSAAVVRSDPDVLRGTPVFISTRVPARALFDDVAAGELPAEFLDHFPTVTRGQAVAALARANGLLAAHVHSACRVRAAPTPPALGWACRRTTGA